MTQAQERRRHDLAGRIARATFPVRMRLGELVDDFTDIPCRVLGHNWKEIPSSHLSARTRDAHKLRFKCSRCFLTAGFTNR